ncbi:MAG: hypothetical protein WBA85_05990 [Brucella anthropi]
MIGGRGIYILLSAFASGTLAYIFPTALQQSESALEGIISVFSILAGVLVAVMSIIGDPSMLLSGNWRLGYEHAKEIQKKISNYALLIAMYVIVLIGVLILMTMKDAKVVGFNWAFTIVQVGATFGLLLSIPLPFSLMAIQKERMAHEIERRKSSTKEACK